jgi:hypothetical protein
MNFNGFPSASTTAARTARQVLSCEQEAFVNAVPVAVLVGQESPLDAAAGDIEDGIHEAFAGGWFADVEVGSGSQKF